jgi:tetratricopeptide (TPR) repeat protein
VDAVVEGSVVRSGDRLRITAQLIEANTDRHLWAESYERNFRDVLDLQSEVATAIAQQVNAALTPTEHSQLAEKLNVNPQAHEDYLRGLFFWNKWTEDGVRKSIDYFQGAIKADPSYALAYAGLANSYISMGDFGVGVLPPHQANAAAEQAALKAISLNERLGEAHAALAMSRFCSDGDLGSVEAEFKRAIELSPSSATAHHWYSHYLMAVGRSQEAIAEGERAYDVNPIDPEMGTHMQFLYLFLHRYDDVIEQGRRNLELDPNFGETYFMLAQAFEQKHMYAEAKRDFSKAVDLSGRRSMILASLGHLLAVSGDHRGALEMFDELNTLSKKRYVPSYEKGLVDVGLGNNEAALEDLDRAYKEGSHWMFILQADARLDPLRANPRFQDLLRRIAH